MPSMVSYPRRLQSGQITCYLNRTYHVLTTLAAADYNLRVSAPDRRDVLVSVADPAVFPYSNQTGGGPHSQIWAEMNRQGPQVRHQYDIHLGPPSQVELSLLKWSFHDLDR